MKIRLIIILFLILFANVVNAQQRFIKGIVKDAYSNNSLPFVNIVINNTQIGTSSDLNGEFELKIDNEEYIQLKLSYIGYQSYVTEVLHLSSVGNNYIELLMQPGSESLNEIVVKPSLFPTKKESPVSLKQIGIDQIEKSAGANRDISKVIQSFPGVSSTLAYRNDILVRGGGPSENKFYIDGIEIPTINHFSTQGSTGGPVGILNVDFIRQVDFYSSLFPVSKSNALSSVMEFKQLNGNSESADYKAVLGASELALSLSSPLNNNTTALMSVRRSYLQFLFKALDLPFLPTFTDFQFKTKTKFNEKNELTVLGFGAIDDFKLNRESGTTPENQYILSYVPVIEQESYTVGANYKHFFNDGYLTVILSRNYLNNTSVKYQDNIKDDDYLILDYESKEIENKLRIEWDKIERRKKFNAGILLETSNYYNSTYRKQFLQDDIIDFTYRSEIDFVKYGMFASMASPIFNENTNITIGFRGDGNSYSKEMSNFLDQLGFRFSLSHKISSELLLNGSVSSNYQLPAYTSLGFRDSNGVLINKKNELSYINAIHYVLGVDYQPNDFTKIVVEGFYKDYSDYPFSVQDSVSIASKGSDFETVGDEELVPTGEGRAYGAEFMLRQKSDKGFQYILSYTYVRSEFLDANNEYVPSSWDSRHLLTFTYNKSLKRNWDLGLKWRFVGGLPYTQVDEDKTTLKVFWDAKGKEYLDYSRFNQKRSANFHQLDLRVDKQYNFKGWLLGFYIDIQNLYNYKIKNPEKYVVVLDEVGNPIVRNPDSNINEQRYEFDKISTSEGTVLPTLGIVVEF